MNPVGDFSWLFQHSGQTGGNIGQLRIEAVESSGYLIHRLAHLQFERDRISERTRKALAVKRAQGVRLGRPPALPAEIVARIVTERESGSSLRVIADGLTLDGNATAQGGRAWYASTVRKVLASQRAGAVLQHMQRRPFGAAVPARQVQQLGSRTAQRAAMASWLARW